MATLVDIFSHNNYRTFLAAQYELRRSKNPRYSMRAFSRDIGLPQQAFNNILAERYGVSAANAGLIAKNLRLSKLQTQFFVLLVDEQHARSSAVKREARRRLQQLRNQKQRPLPIEKSNFNIFQTWYVPAVLECFSESEEPYLKLKIAKRLGLRSAEIDLAVRTLVQLGFLTRKSTGLYARSIVTSRGDSDTPSSIIRRFHREHLERLAQVIETQGSDRRKSLSTVLSFSAADLDEAAADIDQFQTEFLRKYSERASTDSIYSLLIHLSPIEKASL